MLLTGVRGYGPWLFCRVETEDGLVGWGEGTNFPGVQPIATAIRNLSTIVVGESAWNIEQLWNRMYRFLYYNGMGGVVLAAISAIDIALYDIVGKKLGVPVYQLLGGKVQERLRVYANGWTEGVEKSPASYAKRTKELVAKGYTGCKFDPFSGAPMNREVTQPQLRDAVALVKAIREAGGPDYDIAIDVHARWNTKSTIEIIRAIQGFRLFFYEEAVPPENIDAMVEVQRSRRRAARHRRAHLRPARLPRAAREAGGPHHPAGHRPHRRHHRVQEDRGDGRHVLHPGRAAQPERADLHGRLDPRLRLDPELPDPRVLRARRGRLQRDHPGRPARRPRLDPADRRPRPRHHASRDDFLKKHAFDEKKTDEMEKRVFDTITFR